MALPVTSVFAAILALWIVFLGYRVVRFRRRTQTSLGTGGDVEGERVIRAHANAVETVPIFLIMLGLAEGLLAADWLLWLTGAVFTVGRLLHGVHLLTGRKPLTLRFWGMVMTVTAIILIACVLLWQALVS